MKNIICTIVLYLSFSLLHAQDTAQHTLAILNIDRVHEYATVDYNNGEQTDLWKLLHLKMKMSRHDITFRCLEFLIKRGYDLAGGPMWTADLVPSQTVEYTLVRKRIN